jgi:hypothetical protein
MHVYPGEEENGGDTLEAAVLDRAAVKRLTEVPGVKLAYPFVTLQIDAQVLDTTISTKARALPLEAARTKLFSHILAGNDFSSDTASEVILTPDFLEKLGGVEPDSLIGKKLIVTAYTASLDSALINVVVSRQGSIAQRIESIEFDSVFNREYRERVLRRELDEGIRRFMEGLFSRQMAISDTLTIQGIGERFESRRIHLAPVVIPEKTARRLTSGGLNIGGDPADLLTAMRGGNLFQAESSDDTKNYPQVTLEIDPLADPAAIKDSVEALGFQAFSFAEQFKEFQRMFLYFNLGLGFIGLVALITAALGIVNTMVMSILERRREIGAIKSLGANEWHIKIMFLVESGVIGALGAIVGILAGWLGTRIASMIFQSLMKQQEEVVFDPFALPIWLILLAFGFGVLVSLLAGLYPASRAARVDPVQALRAD